MDASNWIDLKNKKPKDKQPVIIGNENYAPVYIAIYHELTQTFSFGKDYFKPTHWQPLPPKPTKERKKS